MAINISRRERNRLEKEVVVGNNSNPYGSMRLSLPYAWDDISREYGLQVYQKMMLDDQVNSNVNIFKASVLEEGLLVSPAITDSSEDGYEQARTIAQEAVKMFEYMDTSLDDVLWDMLDCVPYGSRVCEKVFYIRGSGVNQRFDYKLLKTRPMENTSYVVDPYNNVVGLLGVQEKSALSISVVDPQNVIPRDKFLIFSFRPSNNDPRGTSLIRTAYAPWWRKQQILPEYMKYLSQFAGPSLVGTLPEGAKSPDDDERTPAEIMTQNLVGFRNASVLTIPYSAKVDALFSEGDGSAFRFALTESNHGITKAILTQELATEQSRFQARAAAQVHQGILDTLIRQSKNSFILRFKKDIMVPWITYNWGEEAARDLCPKLSLGTVEQTQLTAVMTAIAALEKAGYLANEQRPFIDAILGLPVRSSDELPESQKQKTPTSNPNNPPGSPGVTFVDPEDQGEEEEDEEDSV